VEAALPKINGIEVARRLNRTTKQAPKLLLSMSGYGAEQTRQQRREAGFHHHLVKPLDMDSLRTLLDKCGAQRRFAARRRRPIVQLTYSTPNPVSATAA
jgi:CheY-like chemotaxis protein